jgi:hypothetical protein
MCKNKIININNKNKIKLEDIFIHMYPLTTITKHLSWKTLDPKTNIRVVKFLNFKMKMS